MTLRSATVRHPPAEAHGGRRHRDPKEGWWLVHITLGEAYVSSNSEEVLTTVLGSCVSACIRDAAAGVGGMNHFLLPEGTGQDRLAMRYGVNAMELLINGVLKQGGVRQRLEAKLFGGANMMSSLHDIGARNIEFAKKFLVEEDIPLVGGHLGGTSARRIQFWPASGRARQMVATSLEARLAESEFGQVRPGTATSVQGNDVELF